MDLLFWYALFLAKVVTVVVAIAAIAVILVNVTQRKRGRAGQLQVAQLNERYREMKNEMLLAALPPHEQKLRQKRKRKSRNRRRRRQSSARSKGCRVRITSLHSMCSTLKAAWMLAKSRRCARRFPQ